MTTNSRERIGDTGDKEETIVILRDLGQGKMVNDGE